MDKIWVFTAQIVVVLLLVAFLRYGRRPDTTPNEAPQLPTARARRKRPALRAKRR